MFVTQLPHWTPIKRWEHGCLNVLCIRNDSSINKWGRRLEEWRAWKERGCVEQIKRKKKKYTPWNHAVCSLWRKNIDKHLPSYSVLSKPKLQSMYIPKSQWKKGAVWKARWGRMGVREHRFHTASKPFQRMVLSVFSRSSTRRKGPLSIPFTLPPCVKLAFTRQSRKMYAKLPTSLLMSLSVMKHTQKTAECLPFNPLSGHDPEKSVVKAAL